MAIAGLLFHTSSKRLLGASGPREQHLTGESPLMGLVVCSVLCSVALSL